MKKVLISLFVLISLLLTGCQETSISNSISNSNESSEVVDSSVSDESSTTDEISNYIKNIYVNNINNINSDIEGKKTISTEDVNILYYLGKYGDAYCAIIEWDFPPVDTVLITYSVIVEGETFEFRYIPEFISVYYNNEYYHIVEACRLGVFSLENIRDLHEYFNEFVLQDEE